MTTEGGSNRGSDASDAIRSIWFSRSILERAMEFYDVPCVFEKVVGLQIGGGDA
ncbi:unnamed protein product [Rhodiola kirilowii]